MKYTKATNYALHIMAYFVKHEGKDNLSLQPLASHMNISPPFFECSAFAKCHKSF